VSASPAVRGEPAVEARLSMLLGRLQGGNDARMVVPASDEDLRRVDDALGEPVPPPLRALLQRVGGGLFERGHEIFGASRAMIHDIELVPDLLTVRARLAAEGRLGPHLIPFHRAGSAIHLMGTGGAMDGQVVSLPPGEVYPDLASFLEKVMFK
jgi:hypothetical protein